MKFKLIADGTKIIDIMTTCRGLNLPDFPTVQPKGCNKTYFSSQPKDGRSCRGYTECQNIFPCSVTRYTLSHTLKCYTLSQGWLPYYLTPPIPACGWPAATAAVSAGGDQVLLDCQLNTIEAQFVVALQVWCCDSHQTCLVCCCRVAGWLPSLSSLEELYQEGGARSSGLKATVNLCSCLQLRKWTDYC